MYKSPYAIRILEGKSKRKTGLTQNDVAVLFSYGRDGYSTPTGNVYSRDAILWHYSTIEAFRVNGIIVSNSNCFSRGFGSCPRIQGHLSIPLLALLKHYFEPTDYPYGSDYSKFDPSEFLNQNVKNEDFEFTYRGQKFVSKSFEHYGGYASGVTNIESGLTYVSTSEIEQLETWTNKIDKHLKRQKQYFDGICKTPFSIDTLTKLGFDLDEREGFNGIQYDREHNKLYYSNLIVQDCKYLKNSVIAKLVSSARYNIFAVALVGKDEVGQLWILNLPPLYANASIEACERWVLNIDKKDELVEMA